MLFVALYVKSLFRCFQTLAFSLNSSYFIKSSNGGQFFNMHTIIFLGIDGVLAPWCQGSRDAGGVFDQQAVEHLKAILKNLPQAGLVILGDWVSDFRLRQLRIQFANAGLDPARILGMTPDLRFDMGGTRFYPPRHEEIRAFLFQHPEVLHFAIIDDADPRDLQAMNPYYVYVDPEQGLTERQVLQTTSMLAPKGIFLQSGNLLGQIRWSA